MGICCSKSDSVSNSSALSCAQDAPHRSGVIASATGSLNQLGGHLGELAALNRSASGVSSSRGARTDSSREQTAVTEVLARVRSEIYLQPSNFKSSNKVRGGDVGASRVKNAERELLEMREQALQALYDGNAEVISILTKAKAHNCGELAQLAKHYLAVEGFVARLLEFPNDHSAAVIGADFGGLPADMTQWDSNIYICDPWSNIACLGRDYPDKFRAKMGKWQEQGKTIKLRDRGFVSPLDNYWMNGILDGGKTAC